MEKMSENLVYRTQNKHRSTTGGWRKLKVEEGDYQEKVAIFWPFNQKGWNSEEVARCRS